MLHVFNALCERSCIRRLSAYFAVLPALLLAISLIGPRAQAQTACNVVYTISPQNSSAFGAAITIQNTGTTALSNWTLTWTFANGQTVASLWNGIETQSGANVTVTNEPYNGSIAAGGSLSGIGFNGTWNGVTNAVPTSFAINGTTCGASLGSFKLAPSASTLTVALGASGTDTITVTDVSPFTGSVAFTATGMPTGVTASFSPTASATSSVLTLAVASTTVAGTYPITITGTSGTLTPVTTTITLTVPPASGFTLTPSASALSIAQGSSGTDSITVKDTGTFTGSVAFTASGMPTGVTASFNPASSATSSVLTLAVASTTVAGTYPITIAGTSGTLSATTSISLTVTGLGSFSLSASPTSLTVAPGASGTDTITVKDVSPFAGSVTFAASGLPTGVTAAFSPASSTTSSVVTFTAASTAAAGLSTVTITGTSGTLTATTTIALTVGGGIGACQVVYTISPQSSTAFGAALTIENTSTTPLSSWTLTWTFANGQTVSSLWNGIETQSGANVTVKNESYNGSIPAGGSATGIGFNGTWNGSANAVPTNFAINGTACGGTSPGSFTLKPSAATLSVAPGASGTDTITVTDVSPFTGSVAFAASGMPTGVTATFAPTSSTTSSVLTLTVASTTVAGTYPITITGTSGTLTPVTTSVSLTVSGSGSFTLKPSATTLSVAPGASGTDTITVTDVSPFTGTVAFTATGMPTGVTATFAPTSSTTSSVLTLTVASTTVAGTYPITITGTSGTLTPVTTSITLTVTSAGFTLSSTCGSGSPVPVTQGSSGTCTITVMGATGTGSISASGLPSGVTASSTNPTATTFVITLSASSTATVGTDTITVTATFGGVSESITISMTITAAITANATVRVNQSSAGVAVSDMILGMNLASWYDVIANDAGILNGFESAGTKAVRWPGGSWSDIYHWSTNTNCFSSTDGAPATNDTFANFVSDIVTPGGLDVSLTADYGTDAACTGGGDPTEAAAWAAEAVSLGANVSHITVGNEEYGTWEEDLHPIEHDPTTYANAVATGYYPDIKASSPNVLVGVVVNPGNSPAWDPIVLADAKYDFVEYHYYPEAPGSENDTTLIQQDAQALTTNINTIKSELAAAGHSGTPIYVGEIGATYSNPGKQSWSITQGLYAGQVLGEMMNDGVTRLTWWIGYGNCNGQAGNVGSSVYGWQNFGAYNVFSDGPNDPTCPTGSTAPDWGPIGTMSPTGRAFQLFSQVAVNGELVLTPTVTGDTTDVVAYAATHSGGTALMLFNRNETTSETVSISLSAQTTASTVTVETYNKALYDETDATTPVWAAPTTTSMGAQSLPLTLTLTPWSMNVVIIH